MAIVTVEEWSTVIDERRCQLCGSLHGLRFRAGEGPRPPAHIWCRCVRRVVDRYDEAQLTPAQRIRAGLDREADLIRANRALRTWTGSGRSPAPGMLTGALTTVARVAVGLGRVAWRTRRR